jgi:hypothetical protein
MPFMNTAKGYLSTVSVYYFFHKMQNRLLFKKDLKLAR